MAYRKGATGALLDEYEKALEELKTVIVSISTSNFVVITDTETKDPDCISVQAVVTHVVNSGYGYANYIRKQFGKPAIESKPVTEIQSPADACKELDALLKFTEESVSDKYDLTYDDVVNNIIETRWGQKYDFEQMLEHAIVHILRHRRQIQIFKGRFKERM